MNTFSIKPNGVVIKKGVFYLQQTINCKISKLTHNLKIIIPSLIHFTKENNLKQNGNPFVLYNSYDIEKGITNVSVCIPIKTRIFTSSGSDIICNELEGYTSFKTTLNGDYSHRKTAWKKTKEFINKNRETLNKSIPVLEVYNTSSIDGLSPSKWQTTFYMAVQPIRNSTLSASTTTTTIDNKETIESEQ